MPGDPNALKTLRKFYGDRLAVDAADELTKELSTASDRSVIISLTATVENALEYKLSMAMPVLRAADTETFLNAFRAEGPMGGLSYKNELSFYLGVIDDGLREQIDTLRSIRNAVAHTGRIVSFAQKPLQNAAKRLFAPRGLFTLQDETPQGYRNTFVVEVGFMQPVIHSGRDTAIAELRAAYLAAGQTPPF